MLPRAVEPVGNRRAGRASGGVIRAEHEMIDEQLRTPVEQLSERLVARTGLKAIVLVDLHPRERLPPPGNFVALPGQRLLGFEQIEPLLQPLLAGPDPVP